MPLERCLGGRRVKIVDGTGLSMPDKFANQLEWPQNSGQKPGCSFLSSKWSASSACRTERFCRWPKTTSIITISCSLAGFGIYCNPVRFCWPIADLVPIWTSPSCWAAASTASCDCIRAAWPYLKGVELTDSNLVWRWDRKKLRSAWLHQGTYLLRTNLTDRDPEKLWRQYIQLTEIEAVFRTLKTELNLRPIFHRIQRRVEAHILIAFLGYCLWVCLKQKLRAAAGSLTPA